MLQAFLSYSAVKWQVCRTSEQRSDRIQDSNKLTLAAMQRTDSLRVSSEETSEEKTGELKPQTNGALI